MARQSGLAPALFAVDVNTVQAKLFAWTATALLGAGLAGYVGHFVVKVRPKIWQPPDEKRVQDVLNKVPEVVEAVQQIVPFPDVDRALIKHNWTGREKPAVVEQVQPVAAAPASNVQPVEALLRLVWIQCDTDAPGESRVVLHYKDAARVSDPAVVAAGGNALKKVGDNLDAPLDHIRVSAIEPARVVFAFSDSQRASEELVPDPLSLGLGIVAGGDPSQILAGTRPQGVRYTQGAATVPEQTVLQRPGVWQVGLRDAEYFETNYSDVLANDVRLERHRDSKGKYDGIEFKEVKPGSKAEMHGAKAGDVVKSINGHPVTSQQEAISFVKNNKDKYDVWVVEVVNKGLTKTYTYKSPKK